MNQEFDPQFFDIKRKNGGGDGLLTGTGAEATTNNNGQNNKNLSAGPSAGL